VWPERLFKSHLIGYRIRDLLVCSIVGNKNVVVTGDSKLNMFQNVKHSDQIA
jgi:hypothetical protein